VIEPADPADRADGAGTGEVAVVQIAAPVAWGGEVDQDVGT